MLAAQALLGKSAQARLLRLKVEVLVCALGRLADAIQAVQLQRWRHWQRAAQRVDVPRGGILRIDLAAAINL